MLLLEQPAALYLFDSSVGTVIFPNGFRCKVHKFPENQENKVVWSTSDAPNTTGVSDFWAYAKFLNRSERKKLDVVIKSAEVKNDVPEPRLIKLNIMILVPSLVEQPV